MTYMNMMKGYAHAAMACPTMPIGNRKCSGMKGAEESSRIRAPTPFVQPAIIIEERRPNRLPRNIARRPTGMVTAMKISENLGNR